MKGEMEKIRGEGGFQLAWKEREGNTKMEGA